MSKNIIKFPREDVAIRYLVVYNNGMTALTTKEKAIAEVEHARGKPYDCFYVKLAKGESSRLLIGDLSCSLEKLIEGKS